jgi:hypothetical protein
MMIPCAIFDTALVCAEQTTLAVRRRDVRSVRLVHHIENQISILSIDAFCRLWIHKGDLTGTVKALKE